MSRQKYYTMEVSDKGRYVFLPAERGRYIRTHWSAYFVDCPNENCQAAAKTPCYNIKAYLAYDALVFQTPVHPERKAAYRQTLKDEETSESGHKLKVVKGAKRRA